MLILLILTSILVRWIAEGLDLCNIMTLSLDPGAISTFSKWIRDHWGSFNKKPQCVKQEKDSIFIIRFKKKKKKKIFIKGLKFVAQGFFLHFLNKIYRLFGYEHKRSLKPILEPQ